MKLYVPIRYKNLRTNFMIFYYYFFFFSSALDNLFSVDRNISTKFQMECMELFLDILLWEKYYYILFILFLFPFCILDFYKISHYREKYPMLLNHRWKKQKFLGKILSHVLSHHHIHFPTNKVPCQTLSNEFHLVLFQLLFKSLIS